MKIGFIGLGKLGLPCAMAVESKGHEVIGYDINPLVGDILKNRKLPYLEEGAPELLEKTNPFIPTIYGIGVVRDDNTKYSYLAMLSECLQDYFWLLKNTNTLDRVSDLDFLDYLIKRANIEEDDKTRFDINEIQKGITNILNLSNPLE